jgi:hypothetical protein
MKKQILLGLLYIFSCSFYYIKNNPLEILNFLGQDMIIVLSIIIVFSKLENLFSFSFKDHRTFLFFFVYCFVSSIIMAYINFDQPFFYSILTSRLFLTYLFLYISILLFVKNSKIEDKIVKSVVIFATLLLILLNFYVYLSSNYELISYLNLQERFDDVRFMIGGGTIIYLTIYFIYNLENNKFSYLILFSLFALLLIISKTRGIIIPTFICLIISLINKQGLNTFMKNSIKLLFFLFILAIIMGPGNIISPIEKIFLYTNEDITKGSGNYAFRIKEFVFFWNNLSIKSIIFGYGLDNSKFINLYTKDSVSYFLSDLGVFRILYYHGLIGLALFIKLLFLLFKESNLGYTSVHKFGKGFVHFQLFSFLTMTFYYSMESVFIFFITYIILKTLNSRKKTQIFLNEN